MGSDDAFNKQIGSHPGQGTLVGNWFEEQGLRTALGEGRSVPQRHMPRSGLLKDFTKVPSGGARKQDNTFERVYAPGGFSYPKTSSKAIGDFEDDGVVRIGPKTDADTKAMFAAADEEVRMEEDTENMQHNIRRFDTTSGSTFTKPDESQAEKATMGRASCAHEIMHGETPNRLLGLQNAGLDLSTDKHYSNAEAPTHARMQMACPRGRNDMKLSAVGGFNAFGKHSEFSKPIHHCTLGLAKDEELEKTFQGLKDTQPMRQHGPHNPRGDAFQTVPSLATLKNTIMEKLNACVGATGFVTLRQRLFDRGDHEGFVSKQTIEEVLRNDFMISENDVDSAALNVYLSQLVTMKSTELKIGKFMTSLRPSLSQIEKRRVLNVFASLKQQPSDASVVLGDWLSRLQEGDIKNTIIDAFGAQDEADIKDMPLGEQVFLELLSDLNPLMDTSPLIDN